MTTQDAPAKATRPAHGVLITTMLLYAGFAIPVSIVAMAHSLIVGVLLAAFLAWQWGRLPALLTGAESNVSLISIAPQVPGGERSGTGNSSFDAYRAELLQRLEKEQADFEGFVERLRAAKDKSEFDTFMDDREKRTRAALA